MRQDIIPFRLFDTTNEKVYLPYIKLGKITFKTCSDDVKHTELVIFHLRERNTEKFLVEETSSLIDLSEDTEISVIHGLCEDPRVYDESQKIASFIVHKIHQIDVSDIRSLADANIVEIEAKVEVLITQNDVDSILEVMRGMG